MLNLLVNPSINELVESSTNYVKNALIASRKAIHSYLQIVDVSEFSKDHFDVHEFIKSLNQKTISLKLIYREFAGIDIGTIDKILLDLENCSMISKRAYDYYLINTRFDNLRSIYQQ